MKKILVTTDFSDKSKAGILFAIQMSDQNKDKLTFINIHHILLPSAWDILQIEKYQEVQTEIVQDKLTLFIEKIYKNLCLPIIKIECVVKIVAVHLASYSIMEYAKNNKFNFICISTRGAGELKKIWGTHTQNLINHSKIPIIAVPYKYKCTKIEHVLYASDFINFKKEIVKVVNFVKPLKAKINLLHFIDVFEKKYDLEAFKIEAKKITCYDINFNIKNRNFNDSLIDDIELVVKKEKPSLLIMFTNQNRNWFDKIFLSSKSSEYSFNSKIPLLVFNKS